MTLKYIELITKIPFFRYIWARFNFDKYWTNINLQLNDVLFAIDSPHRNKHICKARELVTDRERAREEKRADDWFASPIQRVLQVFTFKCVHSSIHTYHVIPITKNLFRKLQFRWKSDGIKWKLNWIEWFTCHRECQGKENMKKNIFKLFMVNGMIINVCTAIHNGQIHAKRNVHGSFFPSVLFCLVNP